MKNKTILILVFLFTTLVFSQNKHNDEYLIITYESTFNRGPHGMQNYFWIIPTNEIEEDNGSTSPFYFTVYSKNLLNDCIANKKVSPFNLYKEDDWDFDAEYIKLQKGMSEFIYKNRIKIMTIRKKWESGFKEIIKVYITPVKGDFCKCPISDKNGRNINYQGDIYFPIKNITYNNAFELNNINTYLLHKKMKTENVKNNYW